jgi:hypothetical protein
VNQIIHIKTVLNCELEKAFSMFTNKDDVCSWLALDAIIEPRIGGKYELFWDVRDKRNNSTLGCNINAMQMNRLIAFDWKGPVEYKHVMNNVDPLTQVVVFFSEVVKTDASLPEQTEITLIHCGWRNTEKWEECRLWFVKAWDSAFKKLHSECQKDHAGNAW